MNQANELANIKAKLDPILPKHRDLYYDGKWHQPRGGYLDTWNPATGESLGPCAEANSQNFAAASSPSAVPAGSAGSAGESRSAAIRTRRLR